MRNSRILSAIVFVLMIGVFAVGCRSTTGQSAGAYLDDTNITTQVKAKLAADKTSNLTRVGVKTVNGVVSLDGVVDSVQDKVMAEEIARKVKGVKSVRNDLQINPTPSASPR
jgi:hyperosmotically inducible periplasmic protein